MKPWVLLEKAGYIGERIVSEWDTYDDAYCAKHELYTPEEQDELHVDIMKRDEHGDLTYEF